MYVETLYNVSSECPVCGELLFVVHDLDGTVIRCSSCSRRWSVLRSGATEPHGPHPNLNAAPSDGSYREAA